MNSDTKCKFFLEESYHEKEAGIALEASDPVFAENINIIKTISDFDAGEFCFYIKNKDKEILYPLGKEINQLWIFLENLVETSAPLIFETFFKGKMFVFFVKSASITRVRFVLFDILNPKNPYIDIIIKKRIFIEKFYNALFEIFDNYKAIAFFEPPFIDFEFWTKDSAVIKKYLKKNTRYNKNRRVHKKIT